MTLKWHSLRNLIALLIVGGHLCSFVLLILAAITGAFSTKWTITTSAIIGPLFALYLAIVLKSLATEASSKQSNPNAGSVFAIITLAFILLFSLAIPILIVLKATNRISNYDEFKLYVSMIETACAASVGLIIDTFFGKRGTDNQSSDVRTVPNSGKGHPSQKKKRIEP